MSDFERQLVAWLAERGTGGPNLRLGIGDDMAVLTGGQGDMLVSSDMLLDGVHFDTAKHDLLAVGRKAVACSLSDSAAMAVKPVAVTVSIAWPRLRPIEDAKRLLTGAMEIAEEFGVVLAGGDTTSWDHPLAIDVAITATPHSGIEPVRRGGAVAGDALYVTGPVGGSSLGRHLTFTPRVAEARELALSLGARLHAMMDISDGLSLDLWRMCETSGVGALLDERLLGAVISDDARTLANRDGVGALDHALSDGEDFELLLALEGDASAAPVDLFAVGSVVEQDLAMRRVDGRVEPIEPRGYVH